MALPKKLRILGREFDVEVIDNLLDNAESVRRLRSEASAPWQWIHLDGKLSKDHKAQAITAQTIGILCNLLDLDISNDHAHRLAAGMFSVIKSNADWWSPGRTLPRSVDVMGRRFKVKKLQIVRGPNGEDWSGCIDHSAAVINICSSNHPDQQRETLWHEIIHALDTMLCLDMEEEEVEVLSVGFFAVLRDNNKWW